MSEAPPTVPQLAPGRWWEWPQRVSLEAPLVAVVWLAALANAHGLRLMPEVYAGLGLMVWAIYLWDRTMDGRNWGSGQAWTARHSFCARHRRWLGWIGVPVVLVVLIWLAVFRLPELLVRHCLMVGGLVAGYLVWQSWTASKAESDERELSKALVAAALFAVGVCAGVYSSEYRYPDWAVVAGQSLLMGLFAINLLGLSIVERERSGAVVGRPLLNGHGVVAGMTIVGSALVWMPGIEVVPPLRLLSLGVLGGLVMMGTIHLNRSRMSEIGYRCLVDAALVLAGVVLWSV
jgi:hypothetical protein